MVFALCCHSRSMQVLRVFPRRTLCFKCHTYFSSPEARPSSGYFQPCKIVMARVSRNQWPFAAGVCPLLAFAACFAWAVSFVVTTFLTSFTVRGTSMQYWWTRTGGNFPCKDSTYSYQNSSLETSPAWYELHSQAHASLSPATAHQIILKKEISRTTHTLRSLQ